ASPVRGTAPAATLPAPPSVDSALASPGQPLDAAVRHTMQRRYGKDLSPVRVHHDTAAARSARDLGAQAWTTGNDIVFGAGRYAPQTSAGRALIAHELAHVVQRDAAPGIVQRSCSDATFCTPYATTAEADEAEDWLRTWWLGIEGYATYGPEVEHLYELYLDRSPGDSLAPVVFDHEGSYVVRAFRGSGDTVDDVDAVLGLVEARFARAGTIAGTTMFGLRTFLSRDEMENRPINYSNPLSVAGHIAGGIGSSDAGDDYRKITQCMVTAEPGVFGSVVVSIAPHYEVFDAIDFCPGDCGSPAEQHVTIPMSRLEASGRAYDVPFVVRFRAAERSVRIWV
ncbi:DUF4157 domain-containing protein, partial [Tahibacter caeni]|uniref:eCIS core domain-containing protein n=1 Tax=Tahibacter caeni TaxID=1453545 RepID=UPI0021472C80